MSDESSYPTAIVPKKTGKDALARYEKLARSFGDPMAKLFALTNSPNEEMQFKAAAELMPYRYPKLRTTEHTGNAAAAGAGVNIQINIGAAPLNPARVEQQADVVDVTPSPTAVDPLD